MNAPASPPSPDPGFSVEPPPLPEFDCTVDLDLDPVGVEGHQTPAAP